MKGLSVAADRLSLAIGLSGVTDLLDKLADKGREAGSSTKWKPLDNKFDPAACDIWGCAGVGRIGASVASEQNSNAAFAKMCFMATLGSKDLADMEALAALARVAMDNIGAPSSSCAVDGTAVSLSHNSS